MPLARDEGKNTRIIRTKMKNVIFHMKLSYGCKEDEMGSRVDCQLNKLEKASERG